MLCYKFQKDPLNKKEAMEKDFRKFQFRWILDGYISDIYIYVFLEPSLNTEDFKCFVEKQVLLEMVDELPRGLASLEGLRVFEVWWSDVSRDTFSITNHWLSGKLWYLQHSCVGDIIVYH